MCRANKNAKLCRDLLIAVRLRRVQTVGVPQEIQMNLAVTNRCSAVLGNAWFLSHGHTRTAGKQAAEHEARPPPSLGWHGAPSDN